MFEYIYRYLTNIHRNLTNLHSYNIFMTIFHHWKHKTLCSTLSKHRFSVSLLNIYEPELKDCFGIVFHRDFIESDMWSILNIYQLVFLLLICIFLLQGSVSTKNSWELMINLVSSLVTFMTVTVHWIGSEVMAN